MKTLLLGLAAAATLAGALPAFAQPVDAPQHRQEQRIEQGARTGALTPREAVRLQARHDRVARFEQRARYEHGGRLTRHEHRRLVKMEHRDSRLIYRLKHNHRTA